jgi:hypothetical protein
MKSSSEQIKSPMGHVDHLGNTIDLLKDANDFVADTDRINDRMPDANSLMAHAIGTVMGNLR